MSAICLVALSRRLADFLPKALIELALPTNSLVTLEIVSNTSYETGVVAL